MIMTFVPLILVILQLVVFSLLWFVAIQASVPKTTVPEVFAITTRSFMMIKTLVPLILAMKLMDLLFIL
jgi:hypothetical protein